MPLGTPDIRHNKSKIIVTYPDRIPRRFRKYKKLENLSIKKKRGEYD